MNGRQSQQNRRIEQPALQVEACKRGATTFKHWDLPPTSAFNPLTRWAAHRKIVTDIIIVELTALDELETISGIKTIPGAFFEGTYFNRSCVEEVGLAMIVRAEFFGADGTRYLGYVHWSLIEHINHRQPTLFLNDGTVVSFWAGIVKPILG